MNQAHDGFSVLMGQDGSGSVLTAPGASKQGVEVKIARLRIGIDKRLTTIDEKSSSVLKYRTPHFRQDTSSHLYVLTVVRLVGAFRWPYI